MKLQEVVGSLESLNFNQARIVEDFSHLKSKPTISNYNRIVQEKETLQSSLKFRDISEKQLCHLTLRYKSNWELPISPY